MNKYETVVRYKLYHLDIDGTLTEPETDSFPVTTVFNTYGYNNRKEAQIALEAFEYIGTLVIIQTVERQLVL